MDERIRAFEAELRPHLAGDLRLDRMHRVLYATDASLYAIEPLAVLLPRTLEDVVRAVEKAHELALPIIPRGGGTSLAGQSIGAGVIIDFSRYYNQVLSVHPEEHLVRVQPGVVLSTLNQRLRSYGLRVGPDPSTENRATLGGMLATNATGARSIVYGMMVDHVRAVEVVLSDGTVARFQECSPEEWERRAQQQDKEGAIYRGISRVLLQHASSIFHDTPRWWRRSGGYRLERLLQQEHPNLSVLMAGSEGTLAVTTSITLNVVPRPTSEGLAIVHFATRKEALEAVPALLETSPSAIELLDKLALTQCRLIQDCCQRLWFVEGAPEALLLVVYEGNDSREIQHRLERLAEHCKRQGIGYSVVSTLDPQRIQDVWAVRRASLGLIMGVRSDFKPIAFIEDAAVPVAHLSAYISELEGILESLQAPAVFYAHASAGCLHVRPFINVKDATEVAKMVKIAREAMELVKKYEGNISSEHGDGLVRSWLNPYFFSKELYQAYKATKQVFDPEGILNPGKVVDGPPMVENLRTGPDYHPRIVPTYLDFSAEGGFARAVEQCSGIGACRKLNQGTMCPSFMVTQEEMHATRGRANALRAAIAGQLPPEAFTSDAMKEVMDLCVACKACKAECPSAVDMARLKMEWLAHYWEAHKPSLRERFFAYYPVVAPYLAGRLAPVVNRLQHMGWVRKLLHQHMGIAAVERPLPSFASESFRAWYNRRPRPRAGKRVVLFCDTFNNVHHPELLKDAYLLLLEMGYSVLISPVVCCGRPWMSKGFLEAARKRAQATLEALYPFVEEGIPIVGLEPSCLLSFRDEYLVLLPQEKDRVKRLANDSYLIEEFLLSHVSPEQWPKAKSTKVLLHGHCHQKALVGVEPTVQALGKAGYEVEVVDAGCCGMAGSFGYEAEHIVWSRKMAEHRLVPALRAADEQTHVVAPGVSCRTQIAWLTGKEAYHPVSLLLEAWRTPQQPEFTIQSV